MARMKRVYPKRATTYDDQIKTLKQRGAVVEDENKAKEYISSNSITMDDDVLVIGVCYKY